MHFQKIVVVHIAAVVTATSPALDFANGSASVKSVAQRGRK